jgi:hypothetical protein
MVLTGSELPEQTITVFVWLISHQPTVFFSQNKPAPAISHQPNEQAVYMRLETNICAWEIS